MKTAVCSLLIATNILAQPILGEIGQPSKKRTDAALCSDLPHKAREFATLRAALTKARAAVEAIDFSEISISYVQGEAMMNVIRAAHDDIGRADVLASRAETQPSLLFYWYAYTDAVYAKTALHGADSTLRFVIVKFGDEASTTRIAKWRADLDAASSNLDEAIFSTEKLIDGVLESVDKCAFGVVYQRHEKERPPERER